MTYLTEDYHQIRTKDLSLTFHMGRYVPHLVRCWPELINTLLEIKTLLNTPIIGRLTAPVASSCIDIEAGLSKCDMIRTPPDFCASAIGEASASDNANAGANPPRFRPIAHTSPGGRTLLVVGLVWRSSRSGCRWRQVTPQPIAGPSRRRVHPAVARKMATGQ